MRGTTVRILMCLWKPGHLGRVCLRVGLTQSAGATWLPRAQVFRGAVNPGGGTSTTIEVSLRTTVWQQQQKRKDEQSRGDFRRTGVKTRTHHHPAADWCLKKPGKRRRNVLGGALEDFPRSASERWMGFLVWCRCFLNNTKLIFSFSSGGMRPSAICRSTMSSEIKVGWSICHGNFRYPERFRTSAVILYLEGGGAHPQSGAGNTPPGPAGCCLSAGRSSAQTGCGGSAWRRGACSISLLLPPLSPQTSPTYKKKWKKVNLLWTPVIPAWKLPRLWLTWQTLSTLILRPRAEVCPFLWRWWVWGRCPHRPVCGAVVLLQAKLQHSRVTWSFTNFRSPHTQKSIQVPFIGQ